MNSPSASSRTAIELCEEAFFLLRHAPARIWSIYYLGTMPFALGLLYFWSGMTRGIQSEEALLYQSFALTLLFIWMKTWQAMFAIQIRALIVGVDSEPIDWRGLLRIASAQARWQPWGLIILPFSLVITIPFGWIYAYYQNLVAAASSDPGSSRDLNSIALAQAKAWPMQNHILLSIIAGIALFLLVNLVIMLLLLPQLLITFFGVKEVFHPGVWLAANTTFLALVTLLTHLSLDPIIKAAYILRCFYGRASSTGEDLRVALRRAESIRRTHPRALAALVALGLIVCSSQGARTEPLLQNQELDQHITEVLNKAEYQWRLPRELSKEEHQSGWFGSFMNSIGKWIAHAARAAWHGFLSFLDWIRNLFRSKANPNSERLPFSFGDPRGVLYVILTGVVIFLAIFLWRNRIRSVPTRPVAAEATPAIPNLADENVGAGELPEDEWLKLAHRLLAQGELRLGIRALFLAALAHLATRQFVSLAKFKSNRDYERELRRRSLTFPQLATAFSSLAMIYDRIWYGLHPPSNDLFSDCEQQVRLLLSC